jgi:hypothetical protein
MSDFSIVDIGDSDSPDDEGRRLDQRRRFMYSERALLRAKALEGIYVVFKRYRHGLDAFDRVFQLARTLDTPMGLQLNGPPGAGKSTLAKYFMASLPRSSLFEAGAGAIAMRLHKRPTGGALITGMLKALDYPFFQVTKKTVHFKRTVAMDAIKQKGTRLVIIDEADFLASPEPHGGKRHDDGDTVASDILRQIMDETGAGVALLAREGFDIDKVDPALGSRISTRLSLKDFDPGAVWDMFLQKFVQRARELPAVALDLAYLLESGQSERLHRATRGNLRDFKKLVTEATLVCTDQGGTKVDGAILCVAFERVFGADSTRPNPHADKKTE